MLTECDVQLFSENLFWTPLGWMEYFGSIYTACATKTEAFFLIRLKFKYHHMVFLDKAVI